MLYQLAIFFRGYKRYFSRNQWLVYLLKMPKSIERKPEKGLIIIQIDGLSQTQLRHAIDVGNMPLLKRLLTKEGYRLHQLYSGMPSSTPAVQGELFYGVKNCVPAFSFKRHEDDSVVTMLEPKAAAHVESKLSQQGEPLLKGGSAYADIFSGGAKEQHFCSTSLGWGSFFRNTQPLVIMLLFFLNFYSFLRTLILMIVEFLLALIDFVRGLIHGHDVIKELIFVPTRVFICVLLRELVTIGVKLDVTRGLPIIHANFLSYDEQAHRRGPKSLFAHWSLKGIDDAIHRIWRTAKHSAYCDYDLWIYSDHGQEKTLPYPQQFSGSIKTAVVEIFNNIQEKNAKTKTTVTATGVECDLLMNTSSLTGEQFQRIQLLGNRRMHNNLRRDVSGLMDDTHNKPDNKPIITAKGPLGFIYWPYSLSPSLLEEIAIDLVQQAHIPLVMVNNDTTDTDKQVSAWTAGGKFYLPIDREIILGAEHPFLEEVTTDLIGLCQHPDAGDFVISGWQTGHQQSYSFSIEHGAHAGPGCEETQAFALLPDDTRLPITGNHYLRPLDLHKAALHLLRRRLLPKAPKRTLNY